MKWLLKTTLVLFFLLLIHSCTEEEGMSGDKVSGDSPLWVSAVPVSRTLPSYIPNGMYDNFKIYAVFQKGNQQTVVMDGYDVNFTDSWSYVSENQPLQYWITDADFYRFTGGSPISDVISINDNVMTLHITNNTDYSVMACQPLQIEKNAADYGKTVKLRFGYAHCKVSVAFLQESADDVSVTDIRLTPQLPITSEAQLAVTYDWEHLSLSSHIDTRIATSSATLPFNEVTIPANSHDAVLSSTSYYCVPDASNPDMWNLSIMCDGEEKTKDFQNSYQWEMGKHYIYVFSLTEKTVKLVKVISQDIQYFDCNDIINGGVFSDNIMTE